MGIVQESLHIVSAGIVAGKLDEFATGSSCLSASIRKAGVCLLGIQEGITQPLALWVKRGFHHGSVGSYLVRNPGFRVCCAIQDHTPGALHRIGVWHLAGEEGLTYLREH